MKEVVYSAVNQHGNVSVGSAGFIAQVVLEALNPTPQLPLMTEYFIKPGRMGKAFPVTKEELEQQIASYKTIWLYKDTADLRNDWSYTLKQHVLLEKMSHDELMEHIGG